MQFGSLRAPAPLGHLVWWAGSAPVTAGDVQTAWARAGLPAVTEEFPAALEATLNGWLAVPVLERSGVFWLTPEFDGSLAALRRAFTQLQGWHLHTVPVRASADTLEALRASASHEVQRRVAALTTELEALFAQPRQRASLLVRRLDAVERLRAQAALHARHLTLMHQGLTARLDALAQRVDAALCARIVA
ncbi:MAG: hypothetical protein Q8K32_12430 [Archangium sp.]|nr:hypothetical protein [Archangium sp.]